MTTNLLQDIQVDTNGALYAFADQWKMQVGATGVLCESVCVWCPKINAIQYEQCTVCVLWVDEYESTIAPTQWLVSGPSLRPITLPSSFKMTTVEWVAPLWKEDQRLLFCLTHFLALKQIKPYPPRLQILKTFLLQQLLSLTVYVRVGTLEMTRTREISSSYGLELE